MLALALTGCGRGPLDVGSITVATYWPEAERQALGSEYSRWLAAREKKGGARTPRIEWVALSRGDDLARAAGRWGTPVDVVLGGPVSGYARLARSGRLVPVERPGRPAWCVARRSAVGRAVAPGSERPKVWSDPRFPEPGDIWDDPRHDPLARLWAGAVLGQATWSEGYATLVRAAGQPRRPGRLAGSALAAVERGEAASTPLPVSDGEARRGAVAMETVVSPVEWVEGVAVVAGGDNPASSQSFLRFLAERGEAGDPPATAADPEAESLLADLLGSTLVDAQDELWTAWAALRDEERSERGGRARRWMTEPPPWPPASIEALLARDSSGALLGELSEQLAPDADVRGWLVRSWLAPRRLVDDKLLAELSGAAGGKLAREPRFRAWLRAEWTAWARQRYRRVARQARGEWRWSG